MSNPVRELFAALAMSGRLVHEACIVHDRMRTATSLALRNDSIDKWFDAIEITRRTLPDQPAETKGDRLPGPKFNTWKPDGHVS